MGRPEPCVLFTQTFVHPLLDEYVDEVIFAEPIVITACEFLEQNASSASSAVTLLGATSPPSFALEVFVQCDGEARFRRLCQPFLYSHSSSNVLEVEAVVTNHLVVRGSYRSLSLVVYGNTAEDLGQFNVEFDLDSSLANLVSSSEAKIEDLPPLLLARKLKFDESIFSLKSLPSVLPQVEISTESKQFLQLIYKILDLPNFEMISKEVIAPVTSTAAAFFTSDLASTGISLQQFSVGSLCDVEKPPRAFIEGKTKLVEICKRHMEMGHIHGDFLVECSFLESDTDVAVSKDLVDMLFQHFQFDKEILFVGHPHLSQGSNVLLWLSLALILCSGKESCFHFVNGGGMETLGFLLGREVDNSATTVLLMLLGTVEQATRFSVGCEGLLGWWPREDETVPSSISEGYSQLLKLVMQKQRHDVASLATYVLHRLRFYEVASRYEYTVLCILQGLSGAGKSEGSTLKMLANAKLQLRKLLKLMNFSGWVEDPSPLACTIQSLMVGSSDGFLSYKATNKLITSSSCRFLQQEIDVKLLYLLKERGFFPLSIALISSSELRTEVSHGLQTFVDVTSAIEAVVFSLMLCRTGLVFMLQHSDLSSTMINAFNEGDEMHKCIPLRYAFVLISKGFFCRLREVGINLEMHLRVVNAIDRLLTSTPGTEEFLSVLWELCGLSRSDCGRQALLALGHFSEALTLFIEALHSAKELEADSLTSGTPLNLAIYHAAAELCEIIVTDPTTSSVGAWIGHATDLHKALHSSSPGTNRKDAPTRLLEWIDGGVVYHKNGAIGLLRYAAILASGGDAHMTSTNILVCDSMDVENVVGDSSNESDVNVVDTLLGKLVSDKCFDGVALRDSSVAQLTTAIRILALISENADVAASLYDEGAMTVIYVILVNCRLMLERSSNNYDYLVDDAVECSSTSDLLLERNREKYMIDLLVPSLLLLMELLQRLKESKEQHRNTKLMNALLQLHRELSPKLAACSADLSSSYPESVLSLQVVCHLIASVLASWPAYAWAPGLFHTLLDSVQAASSPALGPKETCSMLCLLNDLFPDEGAWHWKNGMPLLTSARTLAVGTLLGPVIENKVNWYLNPPHSEVLLGQLSPHLDKISQVVLHYSSSALVVMQDMLRIFILRIARQRAESAKVLLRSILSWIRIRVIESSNLGETDSYKAYKMLDFLSRVLEHPLAKPLLLKERAVPVLVKVLERIDAFKKSVSAGKSSVKSGFSISNSCLPVLRSLSFICNSQPNTHLSGLHNCHDEALSMEESASVLHVVFKFCQVLPIGKELLACLTTFKALASNTEAKRALLEAFPYTKSRNNHEDQPRRMHESHVYVSHINDTESRPFPLLYCWINLYRSIEKEVPCGYSIEGVSMLAIGALRFCMDGKSFNKDRINSMKYLFGLSSDANQHHDISEENLKYVEDMSTLLSSKITEYDEYAATSHLKDVLHQAIESARSLSLLLLKPLDSHMINVVISEEVLSYTSDTSLSSKIHLMTDNSSERVQTECNVEELGDKFQWECPENLRNRLSQAGLLGKRKVSALEGANKQGKSENAPSDVRGSTPSTAPPMPTRRDTFRQRKPNTSRPPSMHVDDYVARERNVDGSGNPNVIAVPRVGSTAGRPPSIHVDEFMARQRERQSQNAVAMAGMEMTSSSQGKKTTPESENDTEVSNRSKQLKVDLDDDLQGIDIVFDAEENEPDDKLPFPNADDGLQHTAQSPQRSIVEETQSGVKELEPVVASNKDDNTQSELSSRLSRSHTEMKLRREPSVSSEKKYLEPPEDLKNTNAVAIAGGGFDSGGAKSSVYGRSSPSMSVPNFIPDNNSQRVDVRLSGPRAHHEPKYMGGQPPLPPTPPPPTISPVRSHASEANAAASSHFVNSQNDLPPHSHLGYHVQADYQSSYGNIPASVAASNFMMDTRYSRTSHSSPGGSARPLPPLPPTPPPFSATPMNVPSRSPQSSLYGQSNGVGEVNQFVPPPMMTPNPSRPHSMPFPLHGNIPLQQSDLSGVAQNLHAPPQHSMSMQQLTHLQPLQPPQLPCPPQLSQQIRAPVQSSMQGEKGSPMLQSSRVQMQMQPQQVLQHQPQISPQQMYYQSQPQGSLPPPQQQAHIQHRIDSSGQQQIDPTISLQHYFSSPDAIQSLLSDRDKLCQLLEQHPKLMEMLQERLGQL